MTEQRQLLNQNFLICYEGEEWDEDRKAEKLWHDIKRHNANKYWVIFVSSEV